MASFGCCAAWGGCKDFLKRCENVGYAKGFLQMARFAGTFCAFRGFHQFSRDVNQSRFAASRGGEEALRRQLAIEIAAVLRKIYIANDSVMRALGHESQCFFEGRGAVHVQLAGGESFEKQTAQAYFIVQDENGFAL